MSLIFNEPATYFNRVGTATTTVDLVPLPNLENVPFPKPPMSVSEVLACSNGEIVTVNQFSGQRRVITLADLQNAFPNVNFDGVIVAIRHSFSIDRSQSPTLYPAEMEAYLRSQGLTEEEINRWGFRAGN